MSNSGKQWSCEIPMPEPLAFFLTWTTYGTWLPGDERGWVKSGQDFQIPDPVVFANSHSRMTEPPCFLNESQRKVVEKTIRDHSQIRHWDLQAVTCRSNHVHVVVSANREPEEVRDQFKAWCTRKLKAHERETTLARSASEGNEEKTSIRQKWWTEKGSQRYICDEESLEAVIIYVLEAQDRKDRDIIPQ